MGVSTTRTIEKLLFKGSEQKEKKINNKKPERNSATTFYILFLQFISL